MVKKLLFLLLLFSFAGTAVAQTGEKEAPLKAAFIYNFIRYIDWETTNTDNFVIAVIGSSPITKSLEEIAKTNTANSKKIVIRQYSKPEDIGLCHILFISQNTAYSLQSILNKTGKGILTISEEEGFAKKGTAFNFIIREDKLKFEANLKSIDAAGLKASSQLLKLAEIVE